MANKNIFHFDSSHYDEKLETDDRKVDVKNIKIDLTDTIDFTGHTPRAIAFTPDGQFVLITDKTRVIALNQKEKKIDEALTITEFGNAFYIAVASNGNIVVSDLEKKEVVVFDSINSRKKIATLLWYEEYFDMRPAYDCLVLRPGPLGIAVFGNKVAVSYPGKNAIGIFELSGKFLGVCDNFETPQNIIADTPETLVVLQANGMERISIPTNLDKKCNIVHLGNQLFKDMNNDSTFGPAFMCMTNEGVLIVDTADNPTLRLWGEKDTFSLVNIPIDGIEGNHFLQGIAMYENELWMVDTKNACIYLFHTNF